MKRPVPSMVAEMQNDLSFDFQKFLDSAKPKPTKKMSWRLREWPWLIRIFNWLDLLFHGPKVPLSYPAEWLLDLFNGPHFVHRNWLKEAEIAELHAKVCRERFWLENMGRAAKNPFWRFRHELLSAKRSAEEKMWDDNFRRHFKALIAFLKRFPTQ